MRAVAPNDEHESWDVSRWFDFCQCEKADAIHVRISRFEWNDNGVTAIRLWLLQIDLSASIKINWCWKVFTVTATAICHASDMLIWALKKRFVIVDTIRINIQCSHLAPRAFSNPLTLGQCYVFCERPKSPGGTTKLIDDFDSRRTHGDDDSGEWFAKSWTTSFNQFVSDWFEEDQSRAYRDYVFWAKSSFGKTGIMF